MYNPSNLRQNDDIPEGDGYSANSPPDTDQARQTNDQTLTGASPVIEKTYKRKLSAILYADVAGYSRLTGQDEEGTHRQLSACLDVITECVRDHGGTVCHYAGDAVLADFASVIAAVNCAVSVQPLVSSCSCGLPDDRKLRFRIGVNLGEVIVDREEIYGDCVNVAARLEALATPAGVCLSEKVWAEVKDRLDLSFEDLGEFSVKNIAQPIRAFGILMNGEAGKDQSNDSSVRAAVEKPTVAVLPFDNMSGNPDEGFFADGITEDIITALSRFPSLHVIARNSTFTYKGRAVRVQEIGKDLGARYVVEGSVRRAGQRVRVTVQLIDARDGNHLWAERYDRELTDIFDLQDELTGTIVATLPGRLEHAEIEQVKRKPPRDMLAYDYVLRGKLGHHRFTSEDNAEGLKDVEKAIELDPEFASAHAWKACLSRQALALGWGEAKDLYEQAVESVHRGLTLDQSDIEVHRILCEICVSEERWDDAEMHHERAFSLNPNDARIVAQRGELFTRLGSASEAVEWVERAMRLDPFEISSRSHLLGRALYAARRYQEALHAYRQILTPRVGHLADMAACHAQLGENDRAVEKAAEVLRMDPEFSTDAYLKSIPYKHPEDTEHHRQGLTKAGLT